MQTLEELYTQTLDQVFGYVLLRTRNRALTEDIVSESYLKAAERFHTFTPRAHASRKSWLFTIVRHTLIDTYRAKHYGDVEMSLELPDDAHTRLLEDLSTRQAYAEVMEKLERLPERQREILLLKYKAELRNKEIAEYLQIEEKSVSAALSKATATLRKELRNSSSYVS